MNNKLLSNNFLKPCNDKIKQKKIYGFDIETYGKKNIFYMGSIVNETEQYIFYNKKEMQDFILNSNKLRGCILFATNLGFDFLALFGESIEMLSKFHFIIRGSDFVNINYKYKRNKIIFLDTMNFLRLGVANLGKILNLPKLKKPKCLGKIPKNNKEKKELEIYNIRDSYISFKFGVYLQNSFNILGANIKYTIASTSMTLFRNKYLKYIIQQPKKEIIKEMFKGYYGGRTETFFRGKLDNSFNYYDINSLYPFVMNKYKFPFPNSLKLSYEPNEDLLKFEGLSYCYIETPKNIMYPLLPYRFTFEEDNKSKKLLFPKGDFYGWYSHPEIRKAKELNYNIKLIKTYYYTQTFNPFKDFVTDLYNKRLQYQKENNKMQLAVKILLNSLYGKLAQKLEQTEMKFSFNQEDKNEILKYFDENEKRINENKPMKYKINTPDHNEIKTKDGFVSEPRIFYITNLDVKEYPKFINPILALYVTSYARLELYKLIEEVEKNNKKVVYCDTDSIITDYKFKTSKKLGDLKLEHSIKKGIIIKPKFYYLKNEKNEEVYKIKGIFGIKKYEDFINLLKTKKFKYVKFTKFKESLKRGLNFNQILEVEKVLSLEDNKRIWDKEFNYNELQKSKPFEIYEEHIKI